MKKKSEKYFSDATKCLNQKSNEKNFFFEQKNFYKNYKQSFEPRI